MNRKIIPFITTAVTMSLLSVVFSACGDFLEETSQDKEYVRSWTDLDELLLGDCYVPVGMTGPYNTYQNPGMVIHLLADELTEYTVGSSSTDYIVGNHNETFGARTWQPRIGESPNGTTHYRENFEWKTFYKYINVANNIIEYAKDVPQNTDEEIEGVLKVTGEALFLRGFYYFWLVNFYAKPYDPATAATDPGVPLKTTSEVQDILFERNTIEECYERIVSDLTEAELCLEQVRTLKSSLYQADVTAVRLLLSRVYLYLQDWPKCAEYAQKVIDKHPTLEDLRTTKAKFMTASNPENIFSMDGDNLIRMMDRAHQANSVSQELYNAYSINDLRKNQWFWHYGTFTGLIRREPGQSTTTHTPDEEYYYTGYYNLPVTQMRSPVSTVFWLRSAEAYMNLAEAEAYQKHEEAAKTALRTVLQYRYQPGCSELELTEAGSSLISRIREERRLEFPLEGHRWFDLRRYRVCSVQPEKRALEHTFTIYRDENSGNVVETRLYRLEEDDISWTINIPLEVLQFNVGMADNGNQSRGYQIIATPE